MRVLITGGSGRLAGYVAQEFADQQVILTDLRPPPADRAHLPFLAGDLTTIADCRRVVAESGAEAIVALGAIPYATDRPDRAPDAAPAFDTTILVNVLGLYYLLTAAAEAGIGLVVQTSSIVTVKGGATTYRYLPLDDDHPGWVTDSYVFSKRAGEMMLEWFWRAHGIRTIGCRPAWIWSPEQLQEHARTVGPTTEWDAALWHYVDIRDVARAHRLLFDAAPRLPPTSCYLIAAADHRAPEDSRELVARLRPELLNAIPVELSARQSFVSCAKARAAVGYAARYSWTDWK